MFKAASILLCVACLFVMAGAVLAQPSAEDAYFEFRRWFNAQPEDVRAGDVPAAYRAHLIEQGLGSDEIDKLLRVLQDGRERQEVEMWNRVLTAETPRFNTDPNAYLVRVVKGRQPGRALDVGMGQGRNAIWLAAQGWDVTGFDPADKAVALAQELADEAGVEIKTEIVGSEEFEWVETIHRALRPGGLVMLEAFHDDATKNASIGPGVVFDTNELLERFSDFRILDYEDTTAAADFGKGETRVVRLLAMKE